MLWKRRTHQCTAFFHAQRCNWDEYGGSGYDFCNAAVFPACNVRTEWSATWKGFKKYGQCHFRPTEGASVQDKKLLCLPYEAGETIRGGAKQSWKSALEMSRKVCPRRTQSRFSVCFRMESAGRMTGRIRRRFVFRTLTICSARTKTSRQYSTVGVIFWTTTM